MNFKHLLALIMVIASLLSVGGVSAQWIYLDANANLDISEELDLTLSQYEFAPEEVLPDKEAELGQNHYQLVNNIVNHVTYGLNADGKKSIVKKLLLEDNVGVVYSEQQVSGGNLKKMLVQDSSSDLVQFAVAYQNYDFLIAYTFLDTYLTSSNANSGKIIEVYKTEIIYDTTQGKWIATRSYLGTAPVKRVTASNKQIISIDVTKWVISQTTN